MSPKPTKPIKAAKPTKPSRPGRHQNGQSPSTPRLTPARAAGRPGPINLSRLRLHSIRDREHLARVDAAAVLPAPGASFADWFGSLPKCLGADQLRAVVDAIITARQAD